MVRPHSMRQCIEVNAEQHLPYAFKPDSIALMHKRTVHTVLADLIRASGKTPTEVSRQSGVAQSTLSRILSEKIADPSDKHVSALADYFGVTTDQMRGRAEIVSTPGRTAGGGRETNAAYHPGITPVTSWDDDTPLDDDEVEVPFLKEVELSAGSGRTVIQESSRFKLRFGKYTLRKQGVQVEHAVCVPIYGNSMEPVLRSGATVGVDRSKTTVIDGDLYALNHAGQLRVKQLYRLPGGGIRMRSFNRDEHPDEEYTPEQMQEREISLIGRVFWGAMFF